MPCLQVTNFYRFLYNPETSEIVINLYNSPYKEWVDKALSDTALYTKVIFFKRFGSNVIVICKLYFTGKFPEEFAQSYLLEKVINHIKPNPLNRFYRAKEKNRKKTVRTLVKIVQNNTIEWKVIITPHFLVYLTFVKYLPNTVKLVTDSFHQEDLLWIIKRKKVKYYYEFVL